MKVLWWGITVWWRPLLIWCRSAFWEETLSLPLFPYRLLTAWWYLLFSQLVKHLKTLWSQNRPFWCLMAAPGVLLYLRLKTQALLRGITLSTSWCRMGEEGIIPLFPPISPLSLLSFLSFWSHHQIFPGFYEWRLPESGLGNGWLKKTFEKMRLSKLSPLIKP